MNLMDTIQTTLCEGPLTSLDERLYRSFKHVAAQKFGVAYIKAGTDVESIDLLQNLWKSIFEEINEKPETK